MHCVTYTWNDLILDLMITNVHIKTMHKSHRILKVSTVYTKPLKNNVQRCRTSDNQEHLSSYSSTLSNGGFLYNKFQRQLIKQQRVRMCMNSIKLGVTICRAGVEQHSAVDIAGWWAYGMVLRSLVILG